MVEQGNDRMYNLYFQDLVILKHFMEKAFREDFFNYQEINGMEIIHQKLENIIQQAIANNKKASESPE